MQVVNNNDSTPLTLAELEAVRQFEASNQRGQALFHPRVAPGQPAPNCVLFIEEIGRFAITIQEGRYTVQNGRWFLQEADGATTPVEGNPLEEVWQAAKAVRIALEAELGFRPYVIAVAWFPDMAEDDGILDEAGGRSVHLCFGEVDLAQRLVNLPRDDELQTHLSRRCIQQEVAALSRPTGVEPEQVEETQPVVGGVGALHIGRVKTMNVYITVEKGGGDHVPPLTTVQGQ